MSRSSGQGSHRGYSVLVGHLPLKVTKSDLWDLFEDCGEIVDVYLANNIKQMSFTHGFVRYESMESVKRACADLNRWELKGNKITVELANETALDIQTENDRVLKPYQSVEETFPERPTVEGCADHVQGSKNFSLLSDACRLVNEELKDNVYSDAVPIDMDNLTKDINQETNSRLTTRISKVYDIETSMESAKTHLQKCKCSKACVSDKRADDFMESFRLLLNNIKDFLNNSPSADRGQSTDARDPETERGGKEGSSPSTSLSNSTSETGLSVEFEDDEVRGAVPKYKNALSSSEEESVESSPTASNSDSNRDVSPQVQSANVELEGAVPKHKNALGSSGEESESYSEERCSSFSSTFSSSSDASFSRVDNLQSMKMIIQSVFGRGRGLPSARNLQPPVTPGLHVLQPSAVSSLTSHHADSCLPASHLFS